jgi:membrane-associated phospholipid phosphatase
MMKIGIQCTMLFCLCIHLIVAQPSTSIDSISSFSKIHKSDVLIPSILFGASLICFTHNTILDDLEYRKARNKWLSDFRIHADDYLQVAPIAAVYSLDLFGVKGKNNIANQSYILLKAQIITELLVQPLKYISHVQRPDSSDYHSFPSGHTAEAFMAATFLHKEFGTKSIYYSIAAYTIASSVGLLRIANNRHWTSDVLAGAAFGILATNLAYKVFPLKSSQSLSNKIRIYPSYAGNNMMLGVNFIF